MADTVTGERQPEPTEAVFGGKQSRKEKIKALKKLKRKQIRKEAAVREKEEEEARLNDPEKQLRFRLREQEEAANSERERREFEERERLWLETAAARKAREEEVERRKKLLEEEWREVCKNSSYHLRGNVYVHYKSLESAILAYNTMTARYYAGKQIICEFIGVTRWKVAICGEYMKSRLKTCSHGSACNFIHCFRNPGGDYEWADWDNPPPKYWIKKMSVLFGLSWESGYEKKLESEDYWKHKDSRRTRKVRSHSKKYDGAIS